VPSRTLLQCAQDYAPSGLHPWRDDLKIKGRTIAGGGREGEGGGSREREQGLGVPSRPPRSAPSWADSNNSTNAERTVHVHKSDLGRLLAGGELGRPTNRGESCPAARRTIKSYVPKQLSFALSIWRPIFYGLVAEVPQRRGQFFPCDAGKWTSTNSASNESTSLYKSCPMGPRAR
jgi:hypothetical protein